MLFKDRNDAGRMLADHLKRFKDEEPMVLLVPRGGVEIGLETIKRYHYEWDFIIPKKLGAPHNKEYAIGAVTMDGNYLLYQEYIDIIGVSDEYIQQEINNQVAEIKRRMKVYRNTDKLPDIKDRTVILIDDGVATGFTLLAAIKSIHAHNPKRLVLAIPVAPTDTLDAFKQFTDEIICLHAIDNFTSVGAYYQIFNQVSDEQMEHYINELQDIFH